jgi:general secretion pathway protein A
MYTDWFKLKKLPFRLRPDPEFLYMADETEVVYAALRAAMVGEQRLVCLLGESGVGKTTLLHTLARDCKGSMSVVRVQQPNLTSLELAATLAEQFGLPPQNEATHEPWARLHQYVAAESARGRPVIIWWTKRIGLGPMVRELLNLIAWPSAPLIVLTGEDELSKSLSSPESAGPPRPNDHSAVARLTQAQIAGYSTIGSESQAAKAESCSSRTRWRQYYTGGTPQLINTLCDSDDVR